MTNYILFSGPNCPWCVSAKDLLDNNGIEYTEIKIDSVDRFAFMQSYAPGIRSVPVLMADRVALVGFPNIAAHFSPKV